MARGLNIEQWRQELLDAFHHEDEARARMLVSQPGPRKARTLLEAMLEEADALVRQAAAFGLGELGGAASAKLLEQQLAQEEAQGTHDGEAVVEAITDALGRLESTDARASLIRRLRRLVAGKPSASDINAVACALWRRRHPDLLSTIPPCLQPLPLPASRPLHGLLVLLETSPEALPSWVREPSVPLEYKTGVLMLLEEELPPSLVPALPAFISTAHEVQELATLQRGAPSYYCECLLSLLLTHREPLLEELPPEALSELHDLARELVASVAPNCSFRAAMLLRYIGRPEDVDLLLAHRPEDDVGAKSFEDVVQALRHRYELSAPVPAKTQDVE